MCSPSFSSHFKHIFIDLLIYLLGYRRQKRGKFSFSIGSTRRSEHSWRNQSSRSSANEIHIHVYRNPFDKDGFTLLHRAAKLNHIPSLEALVDSIDVNAKDKDLQTALDISVKENNLNAIRFLLESGCEFPNPPDSWKKCCEFWVSDEGEDSERVVNSDIAEFTRQLTFFYTTASPRPLSLAICWVVCFSCNCVFQCPHLYWWGRKIILLFVKLAKIGK